MLAINPSGLKKNAMLSVIIVLGATLLTPTVFAAKEVNAAGNGSATCIGFPGPASIGLSASAGSKTIAGSGTINYINPMAGKSSSGSGSLTFTSGTISSGSYSLAGQETFNCFFPGFPFPIVGQTTITVSGSCGAGVAIMFKAADGDTGTFTGNAACST